MASAEDFQLTVDRLVQHLAPDRDAKAQAAAAVTITLMLQQTRLPADLAAAAARLTALLESAELPVQRNAAAALSACVESSDSAVQSCIENRTMEAAVRLLEGGVEDGSLQLNLLVLLGTLAEASADTCLLVLGAGGLEQLVAAADPQRSGQVQEAAVDGLCKLAASSAAAKDAAAAAGAIPRLAALLGGGDGGDGGGGGGSSGEVRVRALLCLGMLIGGSPERQLQLAGAPGALACLLGLMRQQDDADCQQIAVGLFKELAANAEAKEALTRALKEAQQAQQEQASAKFV